MAEVRSPPAPAAGTFSSAPDVAEAKYALPGLLFSGMIFAFLGAILPSWGFHLRSDFTTAGSYFLAMSVGMWVSARIALTLIPKNGVGRVCTTASILATAAFLWLAVTPTTGLTAWRL